MGYIINPFWFSAAFLSALDDFESYTAGQLLGGLNGGVNWNGPWVSRSGQFGILATDDFESYTPTDGLDTLNGGNGWAGPWVSR